eukprot:941961-Alexandrium_andersonii.AAC.1
MEDPRRSWRGPARLTATSLHEDLGRAMHVPRRLAGGCSGLAELLHLRRGEGPPLRDARPLWRGALPSRVWAEDMQ